MVKKVHVLLLFMIAATVISIVWFHAKGASKVFELDPSLYTFKNIDDRQQGGKSTSKLVIEDGKAILECHLDDHHSWPFCEISIELTESLYKGVDFSGYTSVLLDIDYQGVGPHQRLRVYFRNSNPAYTRRDDPASLKFNGIEYQPGAGSGLKEISLNTFQVLSWWLSDYSVPVELSAPEFSNVPMIEIATGTNALVGEHKITINKLSLQGSWIKEETLLKFILAVWVVFAIVWIIVEWKKLQSSVQSSQKREKHLKKLNKSLKEQSLEFAELAHRDALTGARNRNAVRDWLDRMAQQVRWGQQSFSVLYLDIDHFKQVNDNYGHQMGDDILREFVLVVSSVIPSTDFLVRWGGEEFIVFCPNTDVGSAKQKADTIRACVEQHDWCHEQRLTCSIGVTELGNERVTEVIARADDALYRAKNNGRNRVEVLAKLMSSNGLRSQG
ncbi:GGDEF domain-containing protein [Vibrio sp. Of7-15]|uniref:GGDEF domain-containing protein n=1 Tax=Vibrio sp. Of7-15 TaxID=2724879 RepID=UPI001EF2B016|nr:GGDEF domain-containing protein [Vibrio sp. Of7-15]MCG7497147.1 GGDEF domain-containing protein [Vibrio sp. Of7-15]